MSQPSTDTCHMAEAIRLARRGLCTTAPNPRVGCVIARGERVLGRGYHHRAGGAHAEVEAIASAAEPVAGATAYVTLEPCSHHGRTPPCADALIGAGLARVVAASLDPNPLVAGCGLERVRAAGIAVECGLLEREALALNPGFFKRMRTGMPWVRLKLAMSLDGRTAMADGTSKWITGEAARADVQRLRAQSCAIVTGVGTVLHDDPRLDVRAASAEEAPPMRQPVRVVVDSRLRTPAAARVIGEAGELIVAAATRDAARERNLAEAGATVLHLPGADGRVDLRALLGHLAEAQCNEVLIEAGATLAGVALREGLVDELVIYMAPTLMGSSARPLVDLPLSSMEQKIGLQITDITAVGGDWRISATPVANT
jgi:diaminohydroxyphosphoribosylaminopyrimidine deaminase / 5-amino-6-(5-phosphoribosylamino)uracil reductase